MVVIEINRCKVIDFKVESKALGIRMVKSRDRQDGLFKNLDKSMVLVKSARTNWVNWVTVTVGLCLQLLPMMTRLVLM